jgi:hypothetical protein
MARAKVVFDNTDGALAYVTDVEPTKVFIQRAYFDPALAPTAAYRGCTLIHEYTHAAGAGGQLTMIDGVMQYQDGHPGTGDYPRHIEKVNSFRQSKNQPPISNVDFTPHPMVNVLKNPPELLDWSDAQDNAYSYDFFAFWLESAETGSP